MELKFAHIQPCIPSVIILLIVPYGIEIREGRVPAAKQRMLLIVPYGIEIYYYNVSYLVDRPFNRTLWN